MTLFYIILSTLLISLGALVGIFTLSIKEEFLNKILMSLVSLSSGAMLGGVFLHLLPEGIEHIEEGGVENFFLLILLSIIIYLFVEKILHWRHCHKSKGECHVHHTMGYMNLIGDAVHNFIDGLIIAGTFIVNPALGLTTTLAVALHEIPQEIGDFGVLLYSGFKKKKALTLNFLVALTTVVGGLVGYFLSFYVDNISHIFIPIAAGGFIYIATSDLLPEIRKTENIKKFLVNFSFLALGILIMFLVKFIGHSH